MMPHATTPLPVPVPEPVHVALRPGARVAVRCVGSGGLPCLFIHGFGEGGFVWHDVVSHSGLPQRQVIVDLPGHGDSSWSEDGRYDTAQYVLDLLAVADMLRLGRFIAVGHSWGGRIAAHMAAAQPERVVGLVVVDTQPEPRPDAAAHVLEAFQSGHRTYRSVQEYAQEMMALRPLPTPERLQAIAAASLRRRDDGLHEPKVDPRMGQAYLRTSEAGNCWEALAAVRCPAMVVRGAISGVLGEVQAQRMARTLRSCTLATVASAGHAVMTDNPGGFLAAVRPFLARFQLAPVPAA